MTEYVMTMDGGHLDPDRTRLLVENEGFRFLFQVHVASTTMIHVRKKRGNKCAVTMIGTRKEDGIRVVDWWTDGIYPRGDRTIARRFMDVLGR